MKNSKKETESKNSNRVTNISISSKTKKISGSLFSKKKNNKSQQIVKAGQKLEGKISFKKTN